MSPTDTIPPGARVGPYVLVEPIGRGASAVVYLAHDREGHALAVKVRKRGVEALDRRFLREFESMRTLRVPGVVQVHEAGLQDDLLWFSMEHVDGRPFLEVLHEEEVMADRVGRSIDLGIQLFDILAELHRSGFVHRDIKASNVLVDAGGRIHVLDFGIVRFFNEGDTLSQSGELLGTIPFMSPEQLSGLPFGRPVDLFAAGLMLHEALAGRRPPPSTTVGWIPRICLERLPPLAVCHPEIPRSLSHLVERLLAADPRARPTASEAAGALRRMYLGEPSRDWPEPPFVEPGAWFGELEDSLGHASAPAIRILDGAAGSGRGRAAEQLHRHATLQGIWPIHLHCVAHRVGAPLAELLEVLLSGYEDEAWPREVVGRDGDTLHRMWPHLPLPGMPSGKEPPSPGEVAEAVARCVVRASHRRPLLLVFRDLELVDTLTARGIGKISKVAGRACGLLLLHDPRWRTPLSHQLVAGLCARRGATLHEMQPLDAAQALEVARGLVPDGVPVEAGAGPPQHAVEAGQRALARWRGEEWTGPDATLWPLAVRRTGVPLPVYTRLVGRAALDGPWVRLTEEGVVLDGETAWKMARARLGDLRSAARALADAWTALGDEAEMADVAGLRLLGGDTPGAWLPAAHAALQAEADGRLADARQWLFLLDSLPTDRVSAGHLGFELAYARTRVTLMTEAGAPRVALLERVEQRAATPRQEQLARVLRAEYQLRQGAPRPALVTALRVASPQLEPEPEVAVRALLVATRCRLLLGQLAPAIQQLDRARDLLAGHPSARLEVEVESLQAEIHLRRNELQSCRRLSQETIRRAAEAGFVRGVALASARLGRTLRLIGRRREAESHTRAARETLVTTGDLSAAAGTALDLATLLVERGDAAAAASLLDEAVRRIRGMGLDELLPAAYRVSLQIATHRADVGEASAVLGALGEAVSHDPELPAAVIAWWRTRGDTERALQVPAPDGGGYGLTTWHLERSLALLAADRLEEAGREARMGAILAEEHSFQEARLQAMLLIAAARHTDDASWARLAREAAESLQVGLYLGTLELDARRLHARGARDAARDRWRTLRARSQELGYRPGVEEAAGWLSTDHD